MSMNVQERLLELRDPLKFAKVFWPHVNFYNKQRDVLDSLVKNKETDVPAGNQLGKDFLAGFVILYYFLTHAPCRIVTTSSKDDHLRVLWGEVGRFIQTSAYPLTVDRGGPLIVNARELRKINKDGLPDKYQYAIGMVAAEDKMAAMQGHHATYTLFVADECSGVPHDYYRMASTWAKKFLLIGNTWDCNNFWRHAIEGRPGSDDRGGDIKSPFDDSYIRKVIRITAEDSPNVRYAKAEIANGLQPSHKEIVPGVLSYKDYVERDMTYDPIQKCVSFSAQFYKGAGNLLFPTEWLNRAENFAEALRGRKRIAKAIGIDPAEGGDKTAMAAVDELGLIELISKKTPDTAVIPGEVIAFGLRHGVPPERWVFDRGGGGKQHADTLRAMGDRYRFVQTVAFGESPSLDLKRGLHQLEARKENVEERYVYCNRRAELYGELSLALEIDISGRPVKSEGFALPREYFELRRQLAPMPKKYDKEGRLKMLPKNKPSKDSPEECLIDLLGCSPDEADAVVLAYHGMTKKSHRAVAGAGSMGVMG